MYPNNKEHYFSSSRTNMSDQSQSEVGQYKNLKYPHDPYNSKECQKQRSFHYYLKSPISQECKSRSTRKHHREEPLDVYSQYKCRKQRSLHKHDPYNYRTVDPECSDPEYNQRIDPSMPLYVNPLGKYPANKFVTLPSESKNKYPVKRSADRLPKWSQFRSPSSPRVNRSQFKCPFSPRVNRFKFRSPSSPQVNRSKFGSE